MKNIYDVEALESLRKSSRVDPDIIRQFRNVLFKKAGDWDEALNVIPGEKQSLFRDNIQDQSLVLYDSMVSEIDGAEKLIFKTSDNHLVETVILKPESGRTALCISSQVGCSCYCSFCATGLMGFSRNLTINEILDQVLIANRLVKLEDRSVRNIVFMGMGEPFLNQNNVFDAINVLIDPAFFNLSSSHITVSTVGIVPGMLAYSEKLPNCRLALSLHSAIQSVRERLMPEARNYPLSTLRTVLEKVSKKGSVMIEYLLLKDITDKSEDLEALIHFVKDLPVHINLIPFNTFAGSNLIGSTEQDAVIFSEKLKNTGLSVTLRRSLGSDIMAACGQLVNHKLK